MLDNFSDNSKIISQSKKNIKTKITIALLALIFGGLSSLLLIGSELSVILLTFGLAFIIPQLITLKMQGSYYKNIKNIVNSRKDMDRYLSDYKESKDLEVVKEKEVSKEEQEKIDKHNLRQKELEMAFSDENYYPYIERIKAKTLKR